MTTTASRWVPWPSDLRLDMINTPVFQCFCVVFLRGCCDATGCVWSLVSCCKGEVILLKVEDRQRDAAEHRMWEICRTGERMNYRQTGQANRSVSAVGISQHWAHLPWQVPEIGWFRNISLCTILTLMPVKVTNSNLNTIFIQGLRHLSKV